MSTPVLSIENLSKTYRLGQIGTETFSRDLEVWWAKTRGKPNPLLKIGETDYGNRDGEELWALRDVSFTVEQGEVLGIIGHNGAGKSTLLKILSSVTASTSGQVKMKGRVASLLEVGTGFHPKLTGRENIYLNGAILVMKKAEIERKFNEIVAFAEIEKFMDTPVKRYSSGMYVRIAFAVAVHLEPEILLVDEVLAVGDSAFQKKCLGKIGDVAKEGRTVLFVSHNMAMILKLCQKCLLLQEGRIHLKDDTGVVVEQYNSEGIVAQGERDWKNSIVAPGNGELRLIAVRIVNSDYKANSILDISKGFYIQMDYQVLQRVSNLALVVRFCVIDGTVVFITGDLDNQNPMLVRETGYYRSECFVPGDFLNAGSYFINVYGHVPHIRSIFSEERVLRFEVLQMDYLGGEHVRRLGAVRPVLGWVI